MSTVCNWEDWDATVGGGELTLRQIRQGDKWHAIARLEDPRTDQPLGFSGEEEIEVALQDENNDYFGPVITLSLTPAMTLWEIMQDIAARFAAYPVMDDFEFSMLYLTRDNRLQRVWLYSDGDDLTAADFAGMPTRDIPCTQFN